MSRRTKSARGRLQNICDAVLGKIRGSHQASISCISPTGRAADDASLPPVPGQACLFRAARRRSRNAAPSAFRAMGNPGCADARMHAIDGQGSTGRPVKEFRLAGVDQATLWALAFACGRDAVTLDEVMALLRECGYVQLRAFCDGGKGTTGVLIVMRRVESCQRCGVELTPKGFPDCSQKALQVS